jgi:lysozyme
MKLNDAGIDLMHQFEGCKLTAYLCPANKWTIGFGNTFYEDGRSVKQGDVISQERADKLFSMIAEDFAIRVRSLLKVTLNENQFSALVSFAYNAGIGNLKASTLLKKVNVNPNDPTIKDEFMKWISKGTSFERGLRRRREAESKLYFS